MGARGSKLSVAQARTVIQQLETLGTSVSFVKISSKGDTDQVTPLGKMKQVGIFTQALEQALLEDEIDLAIHSMKDVPTDIHPETIVHSLLPRKDPRDVLVIRSDLIEVDESGKHILNSGVRIGTSSMRRQSQLLAHYKNIITVDIRGNVDTRLRKLEAGFVDGLVMAAAPFERMDLHVSPEFQLIYLPLDQFPTAPGQGALAVQYRRNDENLRKILGPLIDPETENQVSLERMFLKSIGKGCQLPLGATVFKKAPNHVTFSASLAPLDWKRHHQVAMTRVVLMASSYDQLKSRLETMVAGASDLTTLAHEIKPSLSGKTIVITRKTCNDEIVDLLLRHGGIVHQVETLMVRHYHLDEYFPKVESELETTDWIVITSKNAVPALKSLFSMIDKKRKSFKIACLGKSTAKTIHALDLPVHYVSKGKTGSNLASELIELSKRMSDDDQFSPSSLKIIHLCAREPQPSMRKVMQEHGVQFIEVPVYETEENDHVGQALSSCPFQVDVVLVLSPKQGHVLLKHVKEDWAKKWVAIGPTTAKSLHEKGIKNVLIPTEPTPEAMLEVVARD